MSDLLSVMNKYHSHVTYNASFFNKLTRYYYKLFTKDDDTLSFFGEGLWGVYPIYFNTEDVNDWFEDVLDVDDVGLVKDIHALDSIETNWKRASDLINLTLIYSIYRILNLKINDKEKNKYCTMLLNILHYKFLSSLQLHRFKYPVDKSVAVAVFAGLSKKYLIKVCGTWKNLLDYRANDILNPKGIEYKILINYKKDYDVIYTIQEIQNRIRKMINGLSEEFYKVRERDIKIGVQSKIISDEEGERIGDSVSQYTTYSRYIVSIVGDRSSFAKSDLISIIENTANRLPTDALLNMLYWISDNSYSSMGKKIIEWIENILEFSFKIMNKNQLKTNQLTQIIVKIRAMLLSSRVNDKMVEDIKDNGSKFINLSKTINSRSTETTLRTTMILYIILRTLTMKHYS